MAENRRDEQNGRQPQRDSRERDQRDVKQNAQKGSDERRSNPSQDSGKTR